LFSCLKCCSTLESVVWHGIGSRPGLPDFS
jgi:hypothetical protein